MPQKIRKFLPIILILAIILVAIYYLSQASGENNGTLTASGTVEAIEVVVAFEVSGQIAEVLVNKGDPVQAGDVLVRLEDEILHAQFAQAQAALLQAQANFQLIAAQPLAEQRQVAIEAAQFERLSAQQALQNLMDNADLARANALKSVEQAEDALEDLLYSDIQQALALEAVANAEKLVKETEKRLQNARSTASQADIDAANANVVLLRDALDKATENFEPYADKPEENLTRAHFQAKLAAAQQAYDAAVRRLNALSGTGDEVDIAVAEANLGTAQAQLDQARREYERVKDGPRAADIALLQAKVDAAKREYKKLENGPDPDDLALAQARVESAEANLILAQADTIQAQLDVAQAQVNAAEAALNILQTQLNKLVLTAPVNGVVLNRPVEVGEVAKPGAVVVAIGLLDELSLTVYVPEDRYGKVNLGDEVMVKVDSFPGDVFSAAVVRIADKAEYTPRNVQTAEGRRSTVFAVEIAVDDPSGKLKPGMPADVTFGD